MNDNFYKNLVEISPAGYAYHKVICDEDGIPCDYEFIEVNAAFERFTGLRGSDLAGKRLSEVLPNDGRSRQDWIHLCGDIAINNRKKELELFSETFQRWYKINVCSPEKFYFAIYFVDITKEKNRLSEVRRLVEISEEFLQIDEEKIGYQKITDDFLKICGAKYAVFNLFEEDGKRFTITAIASNHESKEILLNKASNILGYKILGKKWSHYSFLDEKLKNGIITRFQSLRQLVENIIPMPIALLLEKTFNIGEVIIIKIYRKNTFLGHLAVCMKKGESFDKDTLAEIYTIQLGMLIIRKRAEDKLAYEKKLIDAIYDSVPGMLYLYNDQGRLVRWNKKHQNLTGYSSEELATMSILDLIEGEDNHKSFRDSITRAIEDGFSDGEAKLQKKDGTTVPMYFTASSFELDGRRYFAGVGIDITELKEKEREITYLSFHDQLTGLYNRRFYEEELRRLDVKRNLPLTIVMADVNGLKLINDSFGHILGDELLKKVAEVMAKGCRSDDIIARLGGDEFVILLPKTDAHETEKIIKRIKGLASKEKIGAIDLSISFGYETKHNEKENVQEIFKNAENHMYKKKLFESPSMRGKTIEAIIKTLHEKNRREEQHSHRVSELCKCIGEVLELPEYKIEELQSVGLLHDIGKIAIEENILNKPDKLSDEEWKEIKRHPEIGYRILKTVNDMSDLASYVLHHHERWDGQGYPKSLKGEEIPFISRIISIADSYDAMTSERSYRKGLPEEIAIKELEKNAGLQFDPKLVRIFIEKVINFF